MDYQSFCYACGSETPHTSAWVSPAEGFRYTCHGCGRTVTDGDARQDPNHVSVWDERTWKEGGVTAGVPAIPATPVAPAKRRRTPKG